MFCDGVIITTWLAGCLGPSRLVRREGLALRDLEADWERRRILPSAWDLQGLMTRGKRIDLWSAWLQRMLALQNVFVMLILLPGFRSMRYLPQLVTPFLQYSETQVQLIFC